MSPLILYGNRLSGHSYKVRLALVLAGIPHEYRHVSLHLPRTERPADFRATSRWDEVPALRAGELHLVQSNAILSWLADEMGVLPGLPRERQLRQEWLAWESNRIGFSLPNLRYSRCFEPAGEQTEAWLAERVLADLAVLEQELQQRDFILPGGLSIADLSLSGYLGLAGDAGIELAAWPAICRWLAAIAAQPRWESLPALMAPERAANHVAG